MTKGIKKDKDKLLWELLPWSALKEVVKVLTFGAKKYAPRNWEEGLQYTRVYAALHRHLNSWWLRENKDPETGLSHLSHVACCALFLLAYNLWGFDCTTFDDRPIPDFDRPGARL